MVQLNFNLPIEKFQNEVYTKFKKFEYPKPKMVNECNNKGKFTLTPSQEFISEYFTPNNPNGMLLYHSIGSGKSLTGALLVSKFEKLGYLTLWITRTTLRKDLQKALDMLPAPLKNTLVTLSYKQFSNVCKQRGLLYHSLIKRIKKKYGIITTNPLTKTLIIIDESHKLYSLDLKPQEQHNMPVIEKTIFDSYKNPSIRCRVVLMSATPISNDPIEVIHQFNLLFTKESDRFNVDTFKQYYLDINGKFTEKGDTKFKNCINGVCSFVETFRNPGLFAQPEYHNILVPISEELENLDTNLDYCRNEYKKCKDLTFSVKECQTVKKKCSERIKKNKEQVKLVNKKDQLLLMKKRCGIIL